MTVDNSARASVLGISTGYEDMRDGAVAGLPQRLGIIAQAETGKSFPAGRWTSTGAGAAGARYGYRSQIYLALCELQPANGDGVGTIPVEVLPLGDHGSGVAAAGTVTPSGTATKAAAYTARIAGYLSDQFVIPALDLSVAANLHIALRAMGNAISAPLKMPGKVGYTYGTVTAGALVGTGNGTLTGLAVHAGSTPKPGLWSLECVTATTNGGTFKLTDPDGVVVASALVMTAGVGAATSFSDKGGLDFTLTDGTTDFAVGAKFPITVPATNLTFTCGWKGETGNDIIIEILGGDGLGLTFAIVQPTGGLANPDVQASLNMVGTLWVTLGLNCMNIEDTTNLDKIKTWGEGRWGTLMHKPCVVFTGVTDAAAETATAVCSARRDDRINGQLVAPGSVNLPFVVAARQLARIAVVANNKPMMSYQAQEATGLIAGSDAVQWDYLARDLALKAGSSSVEVVDNVVKVLDVVTFWRPEGEEPPAYRYLRHIVILQNYLYNLNLIFAAQEWAAAAIVPDEEPTTEETARKPRNAVAEVNVLIGNMGEAAMFSDTARAKKLTRAFIDSQDPNRLNIKSKVQLSGSANIRDVEVLFGFFFGGATS